jgi:alanine dehydrogenase
MIVGIPKEIKAQENRVGAVPAGVRQLAAAGHTVLVQRGAGIGSGFTDEEYTAAGGTILDSAEELWGQSDMVWKVKEPIEPEYPFLREGLVIYAYLHLAPDLPQTRALLDSGVVAIAFETVETDDGHLPLLAPMSEVAGRMAVQAGAHCLEMAAGGRGVLLGGVPGVRPGSVVIIGGGSVGKNSARIAVGMEADVTIIDLNLQRLRWFDDHYQGRVKTLFSTEHTIEAAVLGADLVVGAALVPGARAPTLVTEEHVRNMKPGAAIVDVAIDQGGSVETIHPTTHADPTFKVHDVVHYGVANIPGAVPRTSTFALHNATGPYGLMLAELGWRRACADDPVLARGLNTCFGKVTHKAVAEAHGLPFQPWCD